MVWCDKIIQVKSEKVKNNQAILFFYNTGDILFVSISKVLTTATEDYDSHEFEMSATILCIPFDLPRIQSSHKNSGKVENSYLNQNKVSRTYAA